MATLKKERLIPFGQLQPGITEGQGSRGPSHGIQRHISVPIGPPLLVDSATYKHAVWVAPCDGWFIKEMYVTGAVSIGSGTNTLAIDNYDKSATAARNVLSTTDIDPDTITALHGLKLTLSTTLTNRYMDEGDVLNATLVCGTQTTAGEGYLLTAVLVGPEID